MRTTGTPASVAMVLGSCVSLQFGAAVATPLLAQFGPALTTAGRLLIAAVLLALIFRPRVSRYTRDQWIAVAYFGFAMAGMNEFFYAAIARIPLGFAVAIEFAGPLLLAAVLSRRRRDLLCVVAAAVAIGVLSLGKPSGSVGDLDRLGVLFALIAAGFWALYIVTGKNLGRHIADPGALSAGMFISAAIVAPFAVGALPALAVAPDKLPALVAVAIMSSLIPYTLEFKAMRHLAPHTFGVLLSLEPAVAAIAGWMLLAQTLTGIQALAIMTVVAAAMTSALGQGGSRAAPPAEHDEHIVVPAG